MSDDLKVYTDKDMVEVVDANGNAIEGMPSVPKAWLDTSLVPIGTKKGKPKSADGASSDPTGTVQPTPPAARKVGEEPKGNASTAEWVEYAREQGAKDADLLDDVGEPLNRDQLREKYAAPPAS